MELTMACKGSKVPDPPLFGDLTLPTRIRSLFTGLSSPCQDKKPFSLQLDAGSFNTPKSDLEYRVFGSVLGADGIFFPPNRS
jgi:hypothetical protein